MVKLLVAVVVLLLLLVAVDIGARVYSQDQLAKTIDRDVAGAQATVAISGFPFIVHLAADGRVDKITAHLAQASDGAFILNRIVITVTDVRIDRRWFLDHHQLKLHSIGTGTVVADMTQANFDHLVAFPVVLGAGTAQATVAGITVTARASVADNHIELSGLPVSIPIPALPVLPCKANVEIVPGNLVASCTFHGIPPALMIPVLQPS